MKSRIIVIFLLLALAGAGLYAWRMRERRQAQKLALYVGDGAAPRLTYDRGTLGIMSPSSEHERYNRAVAQIVEELAAELDVDMDSLGSTTFRREDIDRGFEPDSCLYVRNAPRVRGKKRIDLAADPPPDLVIEIDITSPSLNKFPVLAHVGVPEVWRFDGERLASSNSPKTPTGSAREHRLPRT